MDWGEIIGSLAMLLVFAIGLPLALRKRKKAAPQKMEEFLEHLQEIGVEVSLVESDTDQKKIGVSQGSGRRSEGVIEIRERNIDYISVISTTSQYGVNYYLDFLVKRPDWLVQKKRKRTRMVRKRSPAIGGRTVDIEWKGDDYLSRTLNLEYRLKDRLLQAEPDELKGGISIFPETKQEYSRVRTAYFLPSSDLFGAIDIIAGHIKSGW